MKRIRSDAWKEDNNLKTTLQEYVRRRYTRSEITISVKKQFPQYAWSVPTLSNRLRYFEIRYIDYDIDINT